MKKLLIFTVVCLALTLSACEVKQSNNQPALNQDANQAAITPTSTLIASTSVPISTSTFVSVPTSSLPLVVLSPIKNSVVSSPLKISGYVTGQDHWGAFEGYAGLVKFLDGNGQVLATGPLLTKTADLKTLPIYFATTLTFKNPSTSQATLLFTNENAEGGLDSSREYRLPVTLSSTQVTILVPSDMAAYKKAMDNYTSDGGQDPAKTWVFVKKVVAVPYTTDLIRASAEAAAEQIATQAGSAQAAIAYLKIKDSIAYVVLHIDLDAWAGVSFSENKIRPLVEKTLQQFSQIKEVKFGFAPGDSQADLN